jgi:hypothetical protein
MPATNSNSDPGWGKVQLLTYPAWTEIPPNKDASGHRVENDPEPGIDAPFAGGTEATVGTLANKECDGRP